jgi:heme-degrading monooxygenase HmoA
MVERMIAQASGRPGFLGVESVHNPNGLTITVSYWKSEDAIRDWQAHSEYRIEQEAERNIWYAEYVLRVAKVERTYGTVIT